MTINPPTGEEEVQKYYGSPYLDEIDQFRVAVNAAAANGTEPDTEGIHPLTIAAVSPNLLTEEQRQEVVAATYSENNPDLADPDGQTFMERNGDEETRVDNAVSIQDAENKNSDPETITNEENANAVSDSGSDSNSDTGESTTVTDEDQQELADKLAVLGNPNANDDNDNDDNDHEIVPGIEETDNGALVPENDNK